MEKPTNIHVDNYSKHNNRAAAGWELDGARYHFWFDTNTLEIEGRSSNGRQVIYKNPLVERGNPGFFDTRHLDAENETNAKIVRVVFDEIKEKGLVACAKAEAKAREAAQEVKAKASRREHRIKETGPKLYEALCEIKTHFLDGYSAVLPAQKTIIDNVNALLRELGE